MGNLWESVTLDKLIGGAMDQVFWIMAIVTVIGVSVIAGYFTYKELQRKWKIEELYGDFISLIETTYKSRLSGSNRFIVNQEVLRTVYAEATADEIEGLFKRLVDAKVIDRDPVDQAWSLR